MEKDKNTNSPKEGGEIKKENIVKAVSYVFPPVERLDNEGISYRLNFDEYYNKRETLK